MLLIVMFVDVVLKVWYWVVWVLGDYLIVVDIVILYFGVEFVEVSGIVVGD